MQTTHHDHPTGHAGNHGENDPSAHDEHAAPDPRPVDHGSGHGAGHDAHAGHGDHAAIFRRRFWSSLVLSLPIVFYSHMIQEWFGYTAPHFAGSDLIAPVLGTVVFVYGGWPFLTGGLTEARARRPGMMLLIAMAISVAFAASIASTFELFEMDLWWELALLIDIMLLGHWMEMRAVGQARGALQALAELLPDDADRVTDDGVETVPIHVLAPGDLVVVRPGARVPADGVIESGGADLDESMITGESRPVRREVGDRVVAGTVATDSAIRVRIDAVGEDTALAGIQRLVAEAQSSNSRAQALADRAAAMLFYVAVTAAAITMVTWVLLGDTSNATLRTVTVLVIACPHALGLAIPLVIAISTSMSARNGILIKDRLALERMRSVDVVLFDKTGTLTRGAHVVTDVVADDPDAMLALAASAEADSEHPLARAIVTAAADRGLTVPAATRFEAMTGRGIEAEVEGATIAVGGPALLRESGANIPHSIADATAHAKERGAAVLYVLRDGVVVGAIGLEDEIREESRAAVERLHERGIRVAMITGDAQAVADAVAADLGIDEVFAEVLPEDKDGKVADLQRGGAMVAMVGDGVNDAPALARADVGIAIGAGTDVAVESAGIVLAANDPRAVLAVVDLSKASYRKMLQNLVWAAGYNVLAIPVAAGAFAWAGVVLPPALGAVLMSVSTIVVALNAQLLRRVDLRTS